MDDTLKPFANDSQALTFPSGDDEMGLENGKTEIVLSGTLHITRDADSRENVEALRDALTAILAVLPKKG